MAHAVDHRAQVLTSSGLDFVVAFWLLISPFILPVNIAGFMSNNVLFGILIGVFAAIRFSMPSYFTMWMGWVMAAFGFWVFASPWFLHFGGANMAMVNNVGIGLMVMILAAWGAMASISAHQEGRDDVSSVI